MPGVKLKLSEDEYQQLWELANGRGRNVTLKKNLLLKLLMDHANILGELNARP